VAIAGFSRHFAKKHEYRQAAPLMRNLIAISNNSVRWQSVPI
jgi:hypothetical protein